MYHSSDSTREKIAQLSKEGKTVPEIAGILGLHKTTICYHRKNLGIARESIVSPRINHEDGLVKAVNVWLTRRWITGDCHD